jgi:nucleoside-diphosphate-sugar epimerase
MDMRALITGATGFIGSHLAEELVRRGYEVTCLVRKTSQLGILQSLGVQFVLGDCRDRPSFEKAVEGMDYVFHLAGVITAQTWEDYYLTNTMGTRNLVEACAERNPTLKKFVFVSSISAAGPSEKGRGLKEDDPARPISSYGRSKLLAEEAVLGQKEKLPAVILRPPNVLGPRQRELFESIKLIKRRILPLVGTGEPQTSLCYVGDLVDALILAAESDEARGKIYFVADPRPYAWAEITSAVAEALGIRRFFLKVPFSFQMLLASISETSSRLTHKKPFLTRESVIAAKRYYWIYDGSKIERELGFVPKVTLREAITKTVEWYRERGAI